MRRIEAALRRGGPVLLVGPTATGKTSQAVAAALRLGFGLETVTLDEGWEADDLFGSYRRTTHDTTWCFVPGPVTRWAERAAAGEPMVLVLDELARGHKTVLSAVMRLLNEHPADALAAMRLPLPPGEPGPFYVVDLRATQERIVLPCHRVRIVATANQGEGYHGLDLADPAFGRRWTGGWLHLRPYPPDEAAQVLGHQLGLPATANLITAMQQVAQQVEIYQSQEAILRTTLDLATLLAWGRTTLATPTESGDLTVPQAFATAARDTWLERLCPLQGTQLDPQVERVLRTLVANAAPTTLI
ncbi:MAG: hypothetical protein EOM10_12155 [Opitutae bacterium]|nr:hypothetical protein [Opitutae bacterium]